MSNIKTLSDYISTKVATGPLFRVHAYVNGVETYRSELQPKLRADQLVDYFKNCTDADLVETRLVSGFYNLGE